MTVIGWCLYKLKDYNSALSAFDAALQEEPENTTALVYRGSILSRLGDYTDAGASYNRGLENTSDPAISAVLLYDRGLNFLCMGQVTEARLDFQQAVALDPSRLDAMLVMYWLDLGPEPPHTDSIARLSAIAQTPITPSTHTQTRAPYVQELCQGIVESLTGQWATAIHTMDAAEKRYPDEGLAHFWLAMAYAYLDREAEALAALEHARNEKLPPILFKPLLWLQYDRSDIYPAVVPFLPDHI